MRNLIILVFIFLTGVLGFMVHKDTEMKKQAELNQLIKEANLLNKQTESSQDEPVQASDH